MEADFQPSDWFRFIQLEPFTKKWSKLGLDNEALRALEVLILTVGEKLPVVKGTGGLRKARYAAPGSHLSKRDALRVCYALFPDYGTALLVTVYAKNEQADLGAADCKAVAQVLKLIQEQLDQGVIR